MTLCGGEAIGDLRSERVRPGSFDGEPSVDQERDFLADVAAMMLLAPSTAVGVERALAATCRFLGCDTATAHLLGRQTPHAVRFVTSVDRIGERLPARELPLPVRAAMANLPDDDGLLLALAGADGVAAARFVRRHGRARVRVFRRMIDDHDAVLVTFSSNAPDPADVAHGSPGPLPVAPMRWKPWRIRVAHAVSRFVAQGVARACAEESLRRERDLLVASEARWRGVVDGIHAAIVRVGRDGTVLFATDDVARFGLCAGDMVGRHFASLLPPATLAELEPALMRVFAGERVETRMRLDTRFGERWCELRMAPETDESGEISSLLALAFDITERSRTEELVTRAATTDPLTGLANRTVFVEQLDRSLSSARAVDHQLALLFIDLDKFKRINDTLGHLVGDELLRQVAVRLRSLVRADDVVARLGGDEFAVLVKHVGSVAEVERLVEKLREGLAMPIEVNGTVLHVSGSIGATLSSPEDVEASELLRCADHAMYQAKNAGRNRCQVFDDAMRVALRSRVDMEEALRQAILDEAIDVHYLPEVDLATGRVVAIEALARWNHQDQGLLTASAFMGLAEDSGLIADLGAHVLHTACRDAVALAAHDPSLIVRVNLSARQLGIPRLLGDIAQALLRSGLDAHRLAVEVSEATLVADPEATLDALRRVHQLGVLVSLDDVGTGHSAFTHLERLPVAALKIDRRFIEALRDGTLRDRHIVQNLAHLGKALGVDVIAEGVEHADQLDTLRAIGVTHAQGHLFAGACPVDGVARMLRVPFAHR